MQSFFRRYKLAPTGAIPGIINVSRATIELGVPMNYISTIISIGDLRIEYEEEGEEEVKEEE